MTAVWWLVVCCHDIAAFCFFSSLTFFFVHGYFQFVRRVTPKVHGHFQIVRRITPKVKATSANMKNGG